MTNVKGFLVDKQRNGEKDKQGRELYALSLFILEHKSMITRNVVFWFIIGTHGSLMKLEGCPGTTHRACKTLTFDLPTTHLLMMENNGANLY